MAVAGAVARSDFPRPSHPTKTSSSRVTASTNTLPLCLPILTIFYPSSTSTPFRPIAATPTTRKGYGGAAGRGKGESGNKDEDEDDDEDEDEDDDEDEDCDGREAFAIYHSTTFQAWVKTG